MCLYIYIYIYIYIYTNIHTYIHRCVCRYFELTYHCVSMYICVYMYTKISSSYNDVVLPNRYFELICHCVSVLRPYYCLRRAWDSKGLSNCLKKLKKLIYTYTHIYIYIYICIQIRLSDLGWEGALEDAFDMKPRINTCIYAYIHKLNCTHIYRSRFLTGAGRELWKTHLTWSPLSTRIPLTRGKLGKMYPSRSLTCGFCVCIVCVTHGKYN